MVVLQFGGIISIIFSYEREFASHKDALKANVFMYAGSQEAEANINNVIKLSDILYDRGYEGLQLNTQIVDGEDHMTVNFAAFFRGLKEIYQSSI